MKKYVVRLTQEDKTRLERVASSNKTSIRERKRARILLLSDRGYGPAKGDYAISQELRIDQSTVERVRQRFAEGGCDRALYHKAQEHRKPRVIDGEAEAHLIALSCSTPPQGHKQWTLHLLRDRMVEMRYVERVSHETVRQTLKKTSSSRG